MSDAIILFGVFVGGGIVTALLVIPFLWFIVLRHLGGSDER